MASDSSTPHPPPQARWGGSAKGVAAGTAAAPENKGGRPRSRGHGIVGTALDPGREGGGEGGGGGFGRGVVRGRDGQVAERAVDRRAARVEGGGLVAPPRERAGVA